MNFDYSLLAKYVLEKLAPEEMEQIVLWKNENSENENIYVEIQKLKIAHKYHFHKSPEKTDAALEKVNKIINRKTKKTIGMHILKYAAAIALIIVTIVFGRHAFQTESYTVITVDDRSDVKKLVLDDGTHVWINKSSTLRIPASFSENNRRIEIEGEIYFDVKKNLQVPFVVSTDFLNVKVTGTSFNIKTNSLNGIFETILVSGKIILQDKKAQDILELSPGEKVTYYHKKNEYNIEKIDANVRTSWHLDQLTFDSVTLREIANKLSLVYNVNINIQSKLLADKKLRCVVNKDESLEEVMNQLKYIIGFKYQIDGAEIFITKE